MTMMPEVQASPASSWVPTSLLRPIQRPTFPVWTPAELMEYTWSLVRSAKEGSR